jgi:hypothetical protein
MDLDLASAIQFSQVSRRARELASTIFEFRALREHGMEFLCSLIHTGMAPHVSMRSLFSALTTENCQVCGRFGGYVFLPNLTRCCYKCVQKCRPMVSVQSLKVVSQETGLTHEQLKESLPVYKAPIVTSDDPTYIHPLYPYFLVLPGDRTQREYSALSHIAADLDRRGLECPRARTLSRDWRWFVRSRQTLAALPYFNMETGEAQLARYCNACLASQTGVHRDVRSIAPSTRGTGYSREGFVRHFKECQAARDEWRKGVRGIEGLIGAISNRQRQMLMQY